MAMTTMVTVTTTDAHASHIWLWVDEGIVGWWGREAMERVCEEEWMRE
jgi:hypothetical protein